MSLAQTNNFVYPLLIARPSYDVWRRQALVLQDLRLVVPQRDEELPQMHQQ